MALGGMVQAVGTEGAQGEHAPKVFLFKVKGKISMQKKVVPPNKKWLRPPKKTHLRSCSKSYLGTSLIFHTTTLIVNRMR